MFLLEGIQFWARKSHITYISHHIGLLVSNRDLNLPQVLSTELASYPPSMFRPGVSMRLASGKSMLNTNIAVEVSLITWDSPTAVIIDLSATFWTVDWPKMSTVQTFIQSFKVWLIWFNNILCYNYIKSLYISD